ncbi:protoporphyrinogen oxidase [Cohnella suwonensis]|uniref:Coproporphyrinogen III oxidase n=1 Tax=Cohnella suwonensis TaxID=696072 RepID=A0ABW0M382_9BACL
MTALGPVRRVAVLGGGITGLSAAYYLSKLSAERGEKLEVTVLEGSDRLGGMVNTLRREGFVIERGPDSFLARKQPMIDLALDLGLEDELVGTNPAAKKTYISHEDRLLPMPEGMTLGVPTDREKFMRTELVSESGKLRAFAEIDLPAGELPADEPVGLFLERRMGREMVERVFEPLLAGIHAGDLYSLGLQATFPQFRSMVKEQGSLIAGTRESQRVAAEAAQAKAAAKAAGDDAIGHAGGAGESAASNLPASVFMTFRNGLSSVIEALEEALKEADCVIRLGAQIESLELNKHTVEGEGRYRLRLEDGTTLSADDAIVTLPAYAAAGLLAPYTDVTALRDIRYVSVANVVMGYDADGFDHDLDGSGFLVPRKEGRAITASTWTSSKWLHTAPDGKRLVRCYVGRSGDEAGVEWSDEAISVAVKRDLRELMGLTAEPKFVEITRLRHSMPQYPVGHGEALAAFRAGLAERLPGVLATGAAFGGVGLPDCVAQGKQAAQALLAR